MRIKENIVNNMNGFCRINYTINMVDSGTNFVDVNLLCSHPKINSS